MLEVADWGSRDRPLQLEGKKPLIHLRGHTSHEMYRYTLDIATGELRGNAENDERITGHCFRLSET